MTTLSKCAKQFFNNVNFFFYKIQTNLIMLNKENTNIFLRYWKGKTCRSNCWCIKRIPGNCFSLSEFKCHNQLKTIIKLVLHAF